MDKKTLFESLEPKIGKEAARIGIQGRYNVVIVTTFALAGVVILHVTPLSTYWLVGSALALVLAVLIAVSVYSQVRLARLLSRQFKTKVSWYSVPNVIPLAVFEKWLDKLKAEGD